MGFSQGGGDFPFQQDGCFFRFLQAFSTTSGTEEGRSSKAIFFDRADGASSASFFLISLNSSISSISFSIYKTPLKKCPRVISLSPFEEGAGAFFFPLTMSL